MMKLMSIAAIALFMAGSSAFACDGCGCSAKKTKAKSECSSCTKGKEDAKKCDASAKKECDSKKKSECTKK
ncbi:hypothetical protein P4B35_05765 [Pontiellaceae bacterium B12227]|nr:hypothetical protein [Pontiellaceae bacterium B12227]